MKPEDELDLSATVGFIGLTIVCAGIGVAGIGLIAKGLSGLGLLVILGAGIAFGLTFLVCACLRTIAEIAVLLRRLLEQIDQPRPVYRTDDDPALRMPDRWADLADERPKDEAAV